MNDWLDWKPYRDGIFQASVPEDSRTEEIFVNGDRQTLARFPNFDPKAQYFDGFAADAISPERAARWADPAGGYFHAMRPALRADFTWRITCKDPQADAKAKRPRRTFQRSRCAVHRPAQGDYRVMEGYPALALGFVNLRMDPLGVQRLTLRALSHPNLALSTYPGPFASTRNIREWRTR